MEFLIYTIIFLACLFTFLILGFIGKESWFTYFGMVTTLLGCEWASLMIFLLVGKGLAQ